MGRATSESARFDPWISAYFSLCRLIADPYSLPSVLPRVDAGDAVVPTEAVFVQDGPQETETKRAG